MIENIQVEAVDKDSRFVLKRIKTSNGEFTNRKLAISNFMFNCEQDRMRYERPIFNAQIQTYHITWDKFSGWVYNGLKEAQEHAIKNKRVFFTFHQRSNEQLNKLKVEEAEDDFNELTSVIENVPFQLPIDMNLNEWKITKKKLISVLSPKQNLVPIISSRHNVSSFPLIIKEEFGKSKVIGINSYELCDVTEITNLSYLTAINSDVKINQKTSLIINFGYSRILNSYESVAGSFAFSVFAGDVFSERAYNPNVMPKTARSFMTDTNPKNYPYYDPQEKKFNKSLPQVGWYGIDLTKETMGSVSVAEGLNGYKVIKCISHFLQQRDLELINSLILSKNNTLEIMKNYTGWNVFLNMIPSPVSKQRDLSEF